MNTIVDKYLSANSDKILNIIDKIKSDVMNSEEVKNQINEFRSVSNSTIKNIHQQTEVLLSCRSELESIHTLLAENNSLLSQLVNKSTNKKRKIDLVTPKNRKTVKKQKIPIVIPDSLPQNAAQEIFEDEFFESTPDNSQ
jgi:hypothetical protein